MTPAMPLRSLIGILALLAVLFWMPACAGRPGFTLTPTLTPDRSPNDLSQLSRAIEEGRARLSGQFNVFAFPANNFTLGEVKEPWDSGVRWELDFLYHVPTEEHVEPFGGGYLFYEERDWDEGNTRITYDAVGAGIEIGALFSPLRNRGRKPLDIGLAPYARLGAAFQDGNFRNLEADGGLASGDIGGGRAEGTLGVDLRVTLFNRLRACVGGGFTYWAGSSSSEEIRDSSGMIIDPDASLQLRGKDLFVRFGVGVTF